MEKQFDKYKKRGSMHWTEMMTRDPRRFNAYQQARYEWILKIAGDVRDKKVLDLGCGDGSLTYLLAQRGAVVTGIDNEEKGLEFAESNLRSVNNKNLKYQFVKASAYELPFEKERFDIVVSCEVVEHLNYPEKMLKEASRVLKQGGKIILTTPYRFTENPQDPNHVKEFYPSEIRSLLEENFKEIEVRPTHHMMWRSLYTYNVRNFGNRALWRWIINSLVLYLGWNPFMLSYNDPTKFDAFSSICAWGTKK